MSLFSIRQLDEAGLWHVKYSGVVTGATRNEALSAFVRQAEGHPVRGIVVDLRGTDMQVTVMEAYAFGARLAAEPGLGSCHLAFLENDEHAERSKFLETVAINRGRQARVLTDWDAAVAWLDGNEAEACASASASSDASTPSKSKPLTPSVVSRRGRSLRPGVPGG